MRATMLRMLVAGIFGLACPAALGAQPRPPEAPAFEQVEALWTRFWGRVRAGDVEGAKREVHASLGDAFRDGFPITSTGEDVRVMAPQMKYCRLQPKPVSHDRDAVMYRFACRRGVERAEGAVIVRRDVDGAWRLAGF